MIDIRALETLLHKNELESQKTDNHANKRE